MCKSRGTGSRPGLAAEKLCYVMHLFFLLKQKQLTIPLILLSFVPPAALTCKENINEGSSSSLKKKPTGIHFLSKYLTPINRLTPLVEKWNVEWDLIANSFSLTSSQFSNSQKIWNFSHPICM